MIFKKQAHQCISCVWANKFYIPILFLSLYPYVPIPLSLSLHPFFPIPLSLSLYPYPFIPIPIPLSLSLYPYPFIPIPLSLSLCPYPYIHIPLSLFLHPYLFIHVPLFCMLYPFSLSQSQYQSHSLLLLCKYCHILCNFLANTFPHKFSKWTHSYWIKYCSNIVQILYKYCANIVGIFCK